MNNRSKTGIDTLKIALGLGILGDVLLRQTPWGLNVLLFNLAFVAGTVTLLLRRKPEYLTLQTWALLGAQVFFAAMFVWRDSEELRVWDSFAILAILSVLFVPRLKIAARVAGVFQYAIGFLWSALNAWFGSFALLFSDIEWKNTNRSVWAKNMIAVVRGLLIVAPFILIFGALFMAADAAYQGLVERVIYIKPETIFTHTILFSLFAWLSAGYLRGIMFGNEARFTVIPVSEDKPAAETTGGDATVKERGFGTGQSKVDDLKDEPVESQSSFPGDVSILEHINRSDPPQAETQAETKAETRAVASVPDQIKHASSPWDWAQIDNTILPPAFTLGTIEIGVILGLINLLFLSFVIVQLPYLFGGMELVQNTPDFKLAEYARRGFGELVAVSALVLPVLLISHWLVKKDDPFTEKLYRAFAGIQIVLLFVIMASAVQRLVLLTGNLGYGLTTVRLYPMIFMFWLSVVFVWFALTVLRGARQYFAWGALWSAFFILGATHFLNPDEFIVRTNIALMHQGREFDARYNAGLGADATPALVEVLDELPESQQIAVIRGLAREHCHNLDNGDLRSWNWSRHRAANALNVDPDGLKELGKCVESHGD